MKTWLIGMTVLAMVSVVGCKQTGVEGQGGTKLVLEKPANVTMMQGDTAKVNIKIKREKVEGPVSIMFDKLPAGVTVADADQKIVGEMGVYTLKAAGDAALVADSEVQVTAKAASGMATTGSFKLSVEGKKLSLEKPADVKIMRGDMVKVDIKVQRQHVEGPISVMFDKLPAGITVMEADQKIDGSMGAYTLKAAADAALVAGNEVQVTAKAPDGTAGTATFTIAVEEKK